MVMCHYPAGNLKSCEDSGLLTCEHAVNAFGQTLDGLRFLHRSNLPHRDLKPENILVTMEPLFKVVIADFGFAKVIENDTLLQSSRGTLRYMAPELYSHDGYGLEVDIWSLGVLGLEIIYQLPKSPKDASASRQLIRPGPDRSKMFEAAALDKNQKNRQNDAPIIIIANMLKWKGKDRWSAVQCLERGLGRRVFARRSDRCIGAHPGLETSTFRE
ncbi:Protein kinase-like domain protein [Cordyceps fumosorosea ARSEF 2679]|uniref:Protein kinase-like domain protein n=1 Tax=Cordyceps fumosorosea (strain ARSEF 2679) TaxID=1081104 RepID=A0A167V431_CORFA|nr:Protein kinase-like domain protein [Cordyceps fumosorosea ARSEF 2679]OAA62205.1 Protein kinase-like domain protein [Cordyceps fumosorosea ARSEF 2679]